MSLPTLDPALSLLACLAVAVRARDPVLVQQVADRADRLLGDSVIKRTFARLPSFGVDEEDLEWLASFDS